MDRKTIIASLDVLSQNFDESDPIGTDLRTMAYAVSNMSDEELVERMAKKKMEMITCPKCGNPGVMKQTGYCLKCKTRDIGKAAAEACEACGKEPCACAAKEAKAPVTKEEILGALKEVGKDPTLEDKVWKDFERYQQQKARSASDVTAGFTSKLVGSAALALAGLIGMVQAGDLPERDTAFTLTTLPQKVITVVDSIVTKDEGVPTIKNVTTPERPMVVTSPATAPVEATDFWSKEAAEAVQQAILSDVLPEAVVAKKKKTTEPAVVAPETAVEKVPAAEPAVMAKEDVKTTPAPDPKTTPAPDSEPAPETTPVPDAPKEAQVVDTHILAYEGIELGEGNNMDDVTLTAADKAQLDQLFN